MDESEATGRALVSGLSQDTGSIFKSTGAATERPDTKCQDVVENEDLKNGIRVSQSQPGSNDSRAENAEAVAKGESDVPVDRDGPPSPEQTNWMCEHDEALSWLENLSRLASSIKNKTDNVPAKVFVPEASDITESVTVTEPPDAYMFRTKPTVRDCDWHEFKNRYPDEGDCCAIETLLSSRDLDAEIQLEQLDRKTEEKQRSKPRVTAAEIPQPQSQPGDIGDQRLERVRINSAFILAYLAKVTGERSLNRKPQTYLSPFKIFIHYHDKMEAEFHFLQRKFAPDAGQPTDDIPSNLNTDPQQHHVSEGSVQELLDNVNETRHDNQQDIAVNTEAGSFKAYQDMECYMKFMQTRLMPLYTRFEKADFNTPIKVRYSDLWYLFRHGDILFGRQNHASENVETEPKPSGDKSGSGRLGVSTADTQLWRLHGVVTYGVDWRVDDLAEKPNGKLYRANNSRDLDKYTEFYVYYIDFDGKSFAPVERTRAVDWYEGEKAITSLPVYPIRFVKDSEQMMRRLRTRGEKFRDLVSQSHPTMSYMGWTLTHNPAAERINSQLDKPVNFPDHIDSDVVVDFREAYQTCPLWKPNFFTIHDTIDKPLSANDEFAIIQWADRSRSLQTGNKFETVVYRDDIETAKAIEMTRSNDILKLTGDKLEDGEVPLDLLSAKQDISPEDLTLLPSRVFVYSLRDRKFFNADIRNLKPIKRENTTFDKLKISDAHKTTIQAAVYEHFEKKKAQEKGRINNLEISNQDFIRGKGRGLIMLLHGAPGVGKTATAEAVADVYKKPLFPITCGDLGIEPKEVEENLTDIFRLANVWDCILLLDEAEIFLSPRAKRDDNLQRNALVSIFLRILEYYPGILFLTTNRPGALDEAVKSRVHFALLYPQLGKAETIALFQMNIERLRMIEKERAAITNEPEMIIEAGGIINFAKQHYDDFSHPGIADCRWNGRQIRNAFQIASSMARYEHFVTNNSSAGENGLGLYLGAHHFKLVEKTTVEYDEFRKKTLGATDSEIARKNEERGPDSVGRPGSQNASSESRRRVNSPSLQRQSQSSPTVPSSRNRGGTFAGQRGGGSSRLSPGYLTPGRQQTSRGSPAPYNSPYRGQDADSNIEADDYETGGHGSHEEGDLDDAGYHGYDTYN